MKIQKHDLITWKDNQHCFTLFVLSDPNKNKEFTAVCIASNTSSPAVGDIEYDWFVGSYKGSTNWIKASITNEIS